jgi:predicted dehydrogenase
VAAGFHRQAIAANADLGARLVTVGHYDSHRFAEISVRFGVPCVPYDQVLDHQGVDVVSLCTPSGQHAAQATSAARAGKHVLAEKPMALNLAGADAMIAACDRAGTKLGVVLQRRAEPLFEQIHRAVRGGALGELVLSIVTLPYSRPQAYYDQAAWRGTWALDGGGVLMNQGIHLVDLLLWYMGDPVEVLARAGTLHREIEVEDTLAAALRFQGGALATITASTTAGSGFPHRLELYGTRGGIQVEGESVVRWEVPGSSIELVRPQAEPRASAGAGGDPRGIAATGHIAIVRNFIHALRGDHPPRIDGREGRRSLAAVLAIYQAAGLPC